MSTQLPILLTRVRAALVSAGAFCKRIWLDPVFSKVIAGFIGFVCGVIWYLGLGPLWTAFSMAGFLVAMVTFWRLIMRDWTAPAVAGTVPSSSAAPGAAGHMTRALERAWWWPGAFAIGLWLLTAGARQGYFGRIGDPTAAVTENYRASSEPVFGPAFVSDEAVFYTGQTQTGLFEVMRLSLKDRQPRVVEDHLRSAALAGMIRDGRRVLVRSLSTRAREGQGSVRELPLDAPERAREVSPQAFDGDWSPRNNILAFTAENKLYRTSGTAARSYSFSRCWHALLASLVARRQENSFHKNTGSATAGALGDCAGHEDCKPCAFRWEQCVLRRMDA